MMAQDLSAWAWAYPWLAVAAAYLIGSLSFAVVVSRLMGLNDPRSYGSKNPGATNVLRSGNKLAAVLTLLLDAAKGWLPVWALRLWGEAYGLGDASLALVALAAFLGHLYPVFFAFKGGKGVATAAGVLLGLELWLGLACLATWLVVAFFTRYSSLAALVTAVFAPLFYLLGDRVVWQAPGSAVLAVGLIGLLLVWRHAENINRLFAGTEGKIGGKK